MSKEWQCPKCEADNYYCGCNDPIIEKNIELQAKVTELTSQIEFKNSVIADMLADKKDNRPF